MGTIPRKMKAEELHANSQQDNVRLAAELEERRKELEVSE